MSSIQSTFRLEKELIARGLIPADCRLIEISMEPNSALVIRYEVFVRSDRMALFGDAIKAAAEEAITDDERNRRALAEEKA